MLTAIAFATTMLSTFHLGDVKLLDSPFKRAMDLNASVLLQIEPDRLLHNTRKYAGLEPKAPVYGGWESRGIAGHSLGHYLTALSLQYAATGDKRFRERVDYIVHEMDICQQKYGDGYVGALPPLELATLRRLKSGTAETDGGFGFKGGAWVPWYTQHKVLAGLKDAWLLAGCPEAKTVTLKLADWVDAMTRPLPPDQVQRMLGVEHGGMNETLMDLYAATHETRYLDASQRFYHKAVLDPLLAGRDELPGKHANTQIPKVVGMARTYEVTSDKKSKQIAEKFWNIVTEKYTFAIGGNSDREHFFPEGDAGRHLSPETAESCNTYNMLRLTEHLFSWDPEAKYADYYERALYNHILATQDPKSGMYAYFMSLKPGHFRTYSTIDNSFWCCFGTGLENHTKYGEAIYFHGKDDLYVNLFIPSELSWKEKGLVLEQRTAYPEDGVIEFRIKEAPKGRLALHVRCPGWASDGPSFTLNGKPVAEGAKPGEYAAIESQWRVGDVLRMAIPMSLRTEPLKGEPSKVAFLYGPLVLAGDFGTAPNPFAADHTRNERLPTAEVPDIVTTSTDGLTSYLTKAPGKPLEWQMSGAAEATLKPYVQLPFDYTTVYWQVMSPEESARKAEARRLAKEAAREEAARTIDFMQPGEQQSEADHGLQSESSSFGEWAGGRWRDARDGGWFSFRLKLGEGSQLLRLTIWGDDRGRSYDILADGEKLTTYTVPGGHFSEFFFADFPLSEALLQGKSSITIRVQAPARGFAGGIFGAATLRAKS